MENFVELDFITRLYETVKTDLHMLLIEESENKLDYIGELNVVGDKPCRFVTIEYSTVNPSKLEYIDVLGACQLTVNGMLRRDIKMWGKTEVVESFFGVSPKVDSTSRFKISLKLRA